MEPFRRFMQIYSPMNRYGCVIQDFEDMDRFESIKKPLL